MAIVIPRSRSSGALSILSNDLRLGLPLQGQRFRDRRRQRCLAVIDVPDRAHVHVRLGPREFLLGHALPVSFVPAWANLKPRIMRVSRNMTRGSRSLSSSRRSWSPHPDLNRGPHSYQECALPAELCGPAATAAAAISAAAGGQGRIRTTVAFAPDLQSGPFNHSGTCPGAQFTANPERRLKVYRDANNAIKTGRLTSGCKSTTSQNAKPGQAISRTEQGTESGS